MITREQFIEQTRSWVGVPWVHQGRNRNGVDCIGVLIVNAHHFGLTAFDTTDYGRVPIGQNLLHQCDQQMTRKPTRDAIPGDVLLMRLSRFPQHFALLSGEHRIIHARAEDGKVVETNIPETWWKRVVAVYSIPGVE